MSKNPDNKNLEQNSEKTASLEVKKSLVKETQAHDQKNSGQQVNLGQQWNKLIATATGQKLDEVADRLTPEAAQSLYQGKILARKLQDNKDMRLSLAERKSLDDYQKFKDTISRQIPILDHNALVDTIDARIAERISASRPLVQPSAEVAKIEPAARVSEPAAQHPVKTAEPHPTSPEHKSASVDLPVNKLQDDTKISFSRSSPITESIRESAKQAANHSAKLINERSTEQLKSNLQLKPTQNANTENRLASSSSSSSSSEIRRETKIASAEHLLSQRDSLSSLISRVPIQTSKIDNLRPADTLARTSNSRLSEHLERALIIHGAVISRSPGNASREYTLKVKAVSTVTETSNEMRRMHSDESHANLASTRSLSNSIRDFNREYFTSQFSSAVKNLAANVAPHGNSSNRDFADRGPLKVEQAERSSPKKSNESHTISSSSQHSEVSDKRADYKHSLEKRAEHTSVISVRLEGERRVALKVSNLIAKPSALSDVGRKRDDAAKAQITSMSAAESNKRVNKVTSFEASLKNSPLVKGRSLIDVSRSPGSDYRQIDNRSSVKETHEFVAVKAIIGERRYVFGTEIALAAVLVTAGFARVRQDRVVPQDTSNTTVLSPNPALEVESKLISRNEGVVECAAHSARVESCVQLSRLFDQDIESFSVPTELLMPVKTQPKLYAQRNKAIFRQFLEKTQLADASVDTGAGAIDLNAQVPLLRPTVLVMPDDTLQGIAEKYYQDKNLAWLIADLNRGNVQESRVELKRVITLKSHQTLVLPVWSDIAEFYKTYTFDSELEQLICVVEISRVDVELYSNAFANVVASKNVKTHRASDSEA